MNILRSYVLLRPRLKSILCLGVILISAPNAGRLRAQSSPYFQVITNLNPVGYWPLNETTLPPASKPPAANLGTLGALDNGTYSEGAFPGVAGALASEKDSAAVLTGAVEAELRTPFDAKYAGVVPFTVELWFRSPVSDPRLACVASCVDANSPRAGWLIYADGDGSGLFNLRLYNLNGLNPSLSLDGHIPGGTLQSNTWYYLAATFDETNATVYIDGAPAGSGMPASFNGKKYVPSTTGSFTVGARSDSQFQLACVVDEVALYSNVLTGTEILSHYQTGTNLAPAIPYETQVLSRSPLLYYRFDETAPPVATNFGSLAGLANGYYEPGTFPGSPGPNVGKFGANNFACAFGAKQATGVGPTVTIPGMTEIFLGAYTNPVALSAWIKGGPESWYQFPVSQGFGEYVFLEFPDGTPRFSDGTANAVGNGTVIDGKWHFWFGQWDGTNASLYIDGQLVATGRGGGVIPTILPLDIGADPGETGANFDGSVCQVAVFTNMLTQAQIQELYFAAGVSPTILAQPFRAVVDSGQDVSFRVDATGTPPLAFQWYNGLPPSGVPVAGLNLFGTINNELAFTNVKSTQSGNYFLVVSNAYGSITTSVIKLDVFNSALPVITNLPATQIQIRAATLNGQILAQGNDFSSVTLYYGTTDGGTNESAWEQSVDLGIQFDAFSQLVSGLLPNKRYFFTAKATIASGSSWAVPSKSLVTLPLTRPAVEVLPATGLVPNSAVLNGAVTSTGGDTPWVALYYGPTDAGTNQAAWANNVQVGLQSAVFEQTVLGLVSNSTYYFRAQATNAEGIAWATNSLSFTTPASNPFSASVLTHHNDNGRTGRNENELILNTGNVNTNLFGLLYTRPVDDQVYAQPLLVTGVNLGTNGVHNIVLVATVNNSVYAYDADDASVVEPYWVRSFINPPEVVAVNNADLSAIGACGGAYHDFTGNIGIVGTPVVDAPSDTMYFVTKTKEITGGLIRFVQRLHAIDIASGAERTNSPVDIQATYRGNGAGNSGGVLTFDPLRQNQRPGLALVNGVVYIAWSSHCDQGPYHGWVIGYDAKTLHQVVVYNDTPQGSNGGIWMSGQAPAADTNGNLYLSTGNGSVDTSGAVNRGESFLKLTLSGTNLLVSSWFTPYNWPQLEAGDIDLGSGGMLLVPGSNLAFSGGKEGVVYLVNRDQMGGLSSGVSDSNVVQTFRVTSDEVHGGAVWWDGPANACIYIWPSSTDLQQYQFDRSAGKFLLPALAQSPTTAPNGQPGGILSLSANGTNAGSGILWAAHQLSGDANQRSQPGILRAFDAQNVSQELWNSEQLSAQDSVGTFAKFVPPTVANGKVYLATFSNRLNVYGLLPSLPLSVNAAGGRIQLMWRGAILQSADQVLGPYHDVANALPPMLVIPSAAHQYYRLRFETNR
jgi:hypothetical protein